MRVLICNKCESFYELQDNENYSDFDTCQCNGELWCIESSKKIPDFLTIKKDYTKLLEMFNQQRIRFNIKEEDIPISLLENENLIFLDKTSIVDLDLNKRVQNFIDSGYIVITNKRLIFFGEKLLIFDLEDIEYIEASFKNLDINFIDLLPIKKINFYGMEAKIKPPFKNRKYSILFTGEMLKIIIENAIKNHLEYINGLY